MDVAYENGAALVRTGCFEPRHIFENGQAFRFFPCGANAYEGVAHGRYLRVEKVPEGARLYPCTQQDFERVWKRYFDLERDYAALVSDCGDSVLKQGMQYGCGLRLLNQEPFETLISFIVSANNHVKRIRGILRRICALYGEPFSFEGKTWHRFPAPAILAGLSEEALGECGSGYRAPYIKGAARMAAEGFSLEALRGMGYADAKKELQRLPGVGPKVADCVLLFSLGFYDAFPADVWVRRVLREQYGFTGNDRQIYEFARKRFGPYAGIAQQYLFFWKRENSKS
ncbi:DNA-3-methyladenine glycosylase [Christensenella minuta]|uniref:DNA-3-methyladenine glycosylase family protein n=1 Tax=Christensenella minuta TaxID=626937 RepID=UPI002A81C353|nr:DNA-3-methyladenine glycosylase [Christensenella minuta]MDY3751342.1 DNA-3-methyladenine glycosylase [Christensenella minuta]